MANGRIHRVGLAVSLPTKVAKLLHFQADVQASSEGVREKVASRFGPGFRQNYVISDPSKIPRRYIYIYIHILGIIISTPSLFGGGVVGVLGCSDDGRPWTR